MPGETEGRSDGGIEDWRGEGRREGGDETEAMRDDS